MTNRLQITTQQLQDSDNIQYGYSYSHYGFVCMAVSQHGIFQLQLLDDQAAFNQFEQQLRSQYAAKNSLVRNDILVKQLYHKISQTNETIAIQLQGTFFQLKVWQALLSIPAGLTCSYLQIAQWINQPKAVRAVANAVAANPVAILVPCHRVIRQNGQLGGYRWGLERKQKLLEDEQQA